MTPHDALTVAGLLAGGLAVAGMGAALLAIAIHERGQHGRE